MARPANPELREEILRAATGIIEDCGPDCVTMREVAEKIGYSPTTIYLYFKDKSELLKETVKAASSDLADFLEAASVGPCPIDEVRQRGRAYLVWGVMHPGLYQLMFQQPGDIEWTDADLAETSRGGQATNDAIARAIAAGQIARRDVEPLQFALFAALHGTTSLAISRRIAPGALAMSAPQLIETAASVADGLFAALLAETPAEG